MIRAVVDSSVLLAVLRREPHAAEFLEAVDEAVVSTVNLVEVVFQLILHGLNKQDAWRDAKSVTDRVVAFDGEQSRALCDLVHQTKRFGSSLGDRACLALALHLDLPACTADRVWREVEVGVDIHIVG